MGEGVIGTFYYSFVLLICTTRLLTLRLFDFGSFILHLYFVRFKSFIFSSFLIIVTMECSHHLVRHSIIHIGCEASTENTGHTESDRGVYRIQCSIKSYAVNRNLMEYLAPRSTRAPNQKRRFTSQQTTGTKVPAFWT